MNHSTKETPKQLGFADLPDDPRPAPIIAAEKWGFPLQYHASDGKTLFSIQDWIRGLTGENDIRKLWNKMKNETSVSSRRLDYHASDGKTYQRDYTNDEGLYLIAQYLRNTKDRPMIDEIRQFLAASGSLMDDWRLHPEKMLSAAQSRMQSDIERHEKAGLGNHPNILLLKSKLELSETLKELKGSVSRLLELSNKEWGDFHNEELKQLLGYTAKQIREARDPKKSARENLNMFEANGLNYCEKQLIALLSVQHTMDSQRLRESVRFIFAPFGDNLRGMLESIGIDALSGKYQLPSGKQ